MKQYSFSLWSRARAQRCISSSILACVLVGLSPAITFGQTLPDAGAVQKHLEDQRRSVLPQQSESQFVLPAPLESIGGDTITLTSFRFVGNTRLTHEQLSAAVAEFLGRPLDFAGLQNAAIAVATAYREAGWVVRAYLPKQDIADSIVTIQIVEAKFGTVRVEGGEAIRTSASRLKKFVENAQESDAPLSVASLDRGLLLINDLPGVSATGRLAAGASHAETDLIMDVIDGPLVNGNVNADNAGSRFTGAERVVVIASLNSRLGTGDRADALLLHSEGNDYLSLGYSMPIGSSGWRVGANASHLDYQIVTREFAALDAHGASNTFGFDASYPLLRTRSKNLYFTFNGEENRLENKSAGETTTDYSVRAATAGLYGNLYDAFLGGGVNTASLHLMYGEVDLSGSPNELADSLTTRTDGSFSTMRLSASRLQMISKRFSVFANLSAQMASKNLDSSRKLYLGGSQGIRAYPENEAGGSEGMMLNVEGRTSITENIHVTGFVDWGRVKVNKDNDIVGALARNAMTLKGAGVSVGWMSSFGLNLKGTYARRIGDNPNPTPTGEDQDGTLEKNRVWLQASMSF
jgi:hemolysin activation/secretion protein